MGRINSGALTGQMRGKVGDIVFGSWRGRQYARSKVTPANPQSVAQTATRAAMAIVVMSWRYLVADIISAWNAAAKGLPKSGFNMFTSANVADEITDNWRTVAPASIGVNNVTGLAFSTGSGAGEIDADWTAGDAEPTDDVQFVVRIAESGELVIQSSWEALVSAETATIDGLTAGQAYVCYAVVRHTDNGVYTYSVTNYGTATAHA
jgi:hypothetical protein